MAKLAHSGAFLLAMCMLAAAAVHAREKLKVGDMPPPRLNWSTKLSDYRGKIVVISFWASWCPPCREEMGLLAGLQKAATRDKLVIFAVNWRESGEVFSRIKGALRNVDLTLISDPDGFIGESYDVDAIPHMVVLGRDGRVAAIHVGYGESEIPALVAEINSLWAQPPGQASQSSGPAAQPPAPASQSVSPATQPSAQTPPASPSPPSPPASSPR